MTDGSEWMTPSEAALELGVDRTRVHRLISSGRLNAERHGRTILISGQRVRELAHLLPARGRPMSQSRAWAEVRQPNPDWLQDPGEADRRRRLLHRRAVFRRGRAHKSIVPLLRESDVVIQSGYAAAEHYNLPVDASQAVILGYVRRSHLDALPQLTLRPLASPKTWNAQLGIIDDDAWPFDPHTRFVDPVTLWLDLEDHRNRAARLVIEHLPTIRNRPA